MFEPGYKLVLLLYLTGLASFLPSLFEIDPQVPSTVLLLVGGCYLVRHWPVARRLLAKRSFLLWTVLLAFWPLAQFVLLRLGGELVNFRDLGIAMRDSTLLLGAGVVAHVHGWRELQRVLLAALVIVAIGFVLNWIWPQEFLRVSFFQSEVGEFRGRASSFFKNSGRAYVGVTLIALLLTADISRWRLRARLGTLLAMWTLTALTGSRSGLLTALVATGLILWTLRGDLLRQLRFSRQLAVVSAVAAVAIGSVVALLSLGWVGQGFISERYEELARRLTFFTSLGSIDELTAEKSVLVRLEAQRTYLALIAERPFLGHGPAQNRELIAAGSLHRTSHNTFLAGAFDYGVPYALFLLLVIAGLLRARPAAAGADGPSATIVRQVGVLLLIGCLVTAEMFSDPAVIAMLGAVLAFKVAPAKVLRLPASERAVSRPLVHGEAYPAAG